MKVAITTDWLNSFGGAERVLIQLHALFPEAPIYTTLYDPRGLPPRMQGWDVRPSFIQRLPFSRKYHQNYLPLMQMAFEQFDMSEYDLVITTNSACAKGVITRPGAVNLCYCYTPCRYLWDLYHEYTREHRGRMLIAPVAHWMRMWDRMAADRVDAFVSISHEVAARVRHHYRRDSEVIYPPVDVDRIRPTDRAPEGFYLVVSRLVPYKRIDLAVAACTRLGRRLLVVGDGPERRRLEKMAGPGIEFLGRRPDEELAELYGRCSGFLFPGWEDFGIAPVEAQAAGRPVIAYGRGGALETVLEGTTGVLFDDQNVDEMVAAIERFERLSFDPEVCRRNAERFDSAEFRSRITRAIEEQMGV
ncbi:MAG: glycosyltransferase, partial [Gemmatimonadota bacterium]|nr:glycosyltransferase [Gemmatimonadota bacterium]